MVDLSSVRESAVLRGLGEGELQELAAIAHERETSRGERLFARKEQTDTFYIAQAGRFALTVVLRVLDAESEVTIEELEVPDAFGWSALVAPHESIYSAYCTLDGAVISFPGEALTALMAGNPSLGYGISANLNVLIGNRLRLLQRRWLEEVEQHMDRVRHWMESDAGGPWTGTLHTGDARGLWWRRISWHGFRSAGH